MIRHLLLATAVAALVAPTYADAQSRRSRVERPRENRYERMVRERREDHRALERYRLWDRQERAKRASRYRDRDGASMDSIDWDD